MADRLTYEEFSHVADRLFYEAMEMPTAAKTHKVIQHGSLATHQIYLSRWRDERKKKPSTLEDKLENNITHKFKEFLGEAWKTLKQTSDQKIAAYKQESEKIVQEAQDAVKITSATREEAIKELSEKKLQLESAITDIQLLKGKLGNEEKLRYAAEESNIALQKQLYELKESTQQQITFVKQQYENSENLLKEQLKENTSSYLTKLSQIESERKNEAQLFNAQIDKLKSQNYQLERQYHDKNSALEKSTIDNNKLSDENNSLLSQINKLETLSNDYKKQTNISEMQIIKKDTEIEYLKNQIVEYKHRNSEYENELKEYSNKLGVLQEKLSKQSSKKQKKQMKINEK